jgi:hypothetical protein
VERSAAYPSSYEGKRHLAEYKAEVEVGGQSWISDEAIGVFYFDFHLIYDFVFPLVR